MIIAALVAAFTSEARPPRHQHRSPGRSHAPTAAPIVEVPAADLTGSPFDVFVPDETKPTGMPIFPGQQAYTLEYVGTYTLFATSGKWWVMPNDGGAQFLIDSVNAPAVDFTVTRPPVTLIFNPR